MDIRDLELVESQPLYEFHVERDRIRFVAEHPGVAAQLKDHPRYFVQRALTAQRKAPITPAEVKKLDAFLDQHPDLEKTLDTSHEWIVERTGIQARHFVDPEVKTSDLALEASQRALQAAGVGPQDIDLIIVATSTPDVICPSTACILQGKLGAQRCPAFDVQAVCSGFVYALSVADSMIKSGAANKALVVGAEVNAQLEGVRT